MPSRVKRDGIFISMSKYIFSSDRLLFRQFTIDDALLIHELNSNELVLKYVHELPSTPERAILRLTESIIPHYQLYGYGRWAVHIKENNDFIGWCGLKFRPEREETDLDGCGDPAAAAGADPVVLPGSPGPKGMTRPSGS